MNTVSNEFSVFGFINELHMCRIENICFCREQQRIKELWIINMLFNKFPNLHCTVIIHQILMDRKRCRSTKSTLYGVIANNLRSTAAQFLQTFLDLKDLPEIHIAEVCKSDRNIVHDAGFLIYAGNTFCFQAPFSVC